MQNTAIFDGDEQFSQKVSLTGIGPQAYVYVNRGEDGMSEDFCFIGDDPVTLERFAETLNLAASALRAAKFNLGELNRPASAA